MADGSILTTIGTQKLASATPLDQVNITELAVGDGNGGYPVLDPSMTALVNEVWRGDASTPIRDPENLNILIFEAVIPPSEGGFYVREIALFDDVGDMIAIGQTPEIEKPAPGADQGVSLTLRMYIALDNADQVTLVYSGGTGTADHSGLGNRDAFDAHPNLVGNLLDVTELRETPGVSGNQQVAVIGNDERGRMQVYWDADSTEADNDKDVFEVSGVSTGRWKRIDDRNRSWASYIAVNSVPNLGMSPSKSSQAYYDTVSEKTFFVYAGKGRAPYISCFDHVAGTFETPVKIDDYPLPVDDDHGSPVLTLDNNGNIHVLYGEHDSEIYHAVSSSPRDISTWSSGGTGVTGSYQGLAYDSGTNTLYCAFRAGNNHGPTYPSHEFAGLLVSTDNGATWADQGPIIDLTGHPDSNKDFYFPSADVISGRLHITWNISTGGQHNDVRRDVYHAIYDPSDGNMYSIDGNNLGGVVTWTEMDGTSVQVFQGEDSNAPRQWPSPEGEIYITFTYFESAEDAIGHRFARWDSAGSQWVVVDTGERTIHRGSAGALRHSESELEFFVITGREDEGNPVTSFSTAQYNKFGADLSVIKSSDNGNTWSQKEIISSRFETPGAGVGYVVVPRNSKRALKALYGTASPSQIDMSGCIFAVTDDRYFTASAIDRAVSNPPKTEHYVDTGAIGPVEENASVVDGQWETVDLNSVLPQNCSKINLNILVETDQQPGYMNFRVRGDDGLTLMVESIPREFAGATTDDWIMDRWVPVPDSGIIEYQIDGAGAGAVRLFVRAFGLH